MSSQNTLNTVTSGLDKCGKVIGIVMMICCIVSSISLFVAGSLAIKEARKEKENTVKVIGKITKITNNICDKIVNTDKYGNVISTTYNCNLEVSYNVNNTEYVTNLLTTDKSYSVNDMITLLVKNDDPTKVYYYNQVTQTGTGGYGLLVCGACLLCLCIIHTILYYSASWYRMIICAKGLFNFIRY